MLKRIGKLFTEWEIAPSIPHLPGATAGREIAPGYAQKISNSYSKDNTLGHSLMKSSTVINFTHGKCGIFLQSNEQLYKIFLRKGHMMSSLGHSIFFMIF